MNRFLIVNADDFGLSVGTNRGIIEAHERGVVTSASLMVRQSAADDAADYGRAHAELAVGLHIDLGEWEWRNESWGQVYEVVSTDDERAVTAEIERQLARFRELMRRNPTHLDSHQHVHRSEAVGTVALNLAVSLGIPLRETRSPARFCGGFYGLGPKSAPCPECISVDNLQSILREIPAGTTELCCHPGRDETLRSCYRLERIVEVETLCDPRIRDTLVSECIQLRSFSDAGLGEGRG